MKANTNIKYVQLWLNLNSWIFKSKIKNKEFADLKFWSSVSPTGAKRRQYRASDEVKPEVTEKQEKNFNN